MSNDVHFTVAASAVLNRMNIFHRICKNKISGVFIVCWLPFFVVNLLTGLCVHCIEHEEIVSAVVTWLGWINSSMNYVLFFISISFTNRVQHSAMFSRLVELPYLTLKF